MDWTEAFNRTVQKLLRDLAVSISASVLYTVALGEWRWEALLPVAAMAAYRTLRDVFPAVVRDEEQPE